jgi:hypothetical protein
MKKDKIYLLIFSFVGFVFKVIGQTSTVSTQGLVTFPSPQSAEIAKYSQIPVDYYNGLANINIPLYKFPVKAVDLSVGLSYHGGGIKPNSKGSWTGLGWTLQATGTITRIQNGLLDENIDPNISAPNNKNGYYWTQGTLNRSDWATTTGLKNFLNNVVCQGSYGSGNLSSHPSNPGCGDVFGPFTDWAPDEFVFNFFNFSGSFWLDHTGNWVARENSGEKLKIELVEPVGDYSYSYPRFPPNPIDPPMPGNKIASSTFKGFIITDGFGNKFVFGGNPDNVELNRRNVGGTFLKAIPSSWYLKQIITYLGENVFFEYERKYPSLSLSSSINSYKASVTPNNLYQQTRLQNLEGVVIDPVYLKKIAFNDYELVITYSESPVSQYTSSIISEGRVKTAYNSDYVFYPADDGSPVNPKEFKIDKVEISNNFFFKRFSFTYYDAITANRLFLKSVTEGPIRSSPLVHQFEYNGVNFDLTSDPQNRFYGDYLTTKVDHWGFYNNRFPIQTGFLPVDVNGFYQLSSSTYVPQGLIDAYLNNREPNPVASLVGSLKKIVYPTGGFTEFIYENNDYSQKIAMVGTESVFAGGDVLAGGLRISEIRSTSESGATPLIRKYIYKNEDGFSSGILNSRGVVYEDERNGSVNVSGTLQAFNYKFFFDASQYPLLNTNGNHVTYSRVEEIVENGSRRVFDFSNHNDTKFSDRLPFAQITFTDKAPFYFKTNSRQFARGKVLREKNLLLNTNASIRTEETVYENDDSSIISREGVRTYSLKMKDIVMMSFHSGSLLWTQAVFRQANIWEPNITANIYFLHPYRASAKKVIENSNGQLLEKQETFEYTKVNDKLRRVTSINLSDGQVKSTRFLYPGDFPGIQTYQTMASSSRNMINPVIQIDNYKESKLLSTERTDYAIFNGSLILPESKKSSTLGNVLVKEIEFVQYDAQGNILDALPRSGPRVSYLWGYEFTRPIVRVVNSSILETAATSFENDSQGNWSYDLGGTTVSSSNIPTGRFVFNLSSTRPIYSTIVLGGQKSFIVSYWSANGGYSVNSLPPTKQGVTILGWTYYEHELVNPFGIVTVTGSGQIDELRLRPKGAQMTTYTYSPFTGITSECDVNNVVRYYEYDVLNRLVFVRDQNRNILQRICYNYAGKPDTCPAGQ